MNQLEVTVPPKPAALREALENLAKGQDPAARGAVFTRREVAEFILDLVGYVASAPLPQRRILEPSFGAGDFLIPTLERLLLAWRLQGGNLELADSELADAIRGVEIHRETFAATQSVVIARLEEAGISLSVASELAGRWLIQGDFLLEEQKGGFDFVVGNPPYLRQEMIPAPLLAEYRRRYQTIYDRADLYIPFIERSLSLLGESGKLGFICPDRWTKNRYGGPLREYIAGGFHLQAYVDMANTKAFNSEVEAYPAIVIIAKGKAGATRIVNRPEIEKNSLAAIAAQINSGALASGSPVREIASVVQGSGPWLLETSAPRELIRKIENRFPTLEQAGCQVGIGVATGADQVFIADFESLDVEPERKLPLLGTKDIRSGEIVWRGQGVLNPFADDGKLVTLSDYPKLAHYLEVHREVIARRHCARKAPASWYRTIDRIWPNLASQPKLLIPDIKGEPHVVFEPGKFYPHHNLYYVTSEAWDLRALQAVLLSSLAKLFVATYATKMRGGYLRFQAQYLRRIRIPLWPDVPESVRQELIRAATVRDLNACNDVVCQLYGLNEAERSLIS